MGPLRRLERRASALSSREVWERDVETSARATASGERVNPDRARTVVAVWACQSLIADGVSSLPIDTFRKLKKKGKRLQLDNPSWLDSPNPFETPFTFWHKVVISLVGEDGNAFIRTVRDEKNVIRSMYAVDPACVQIDEDSAVPLYRVDAEEFNETEMIHIPAFALAGKRRGISVIDHAREAIGLALAAEEYGARFFSQGTTMSGVVEHPGKPSPGEVAILGKMLKKGHAGLKNSHAVGILTGGANWKNISVTPEQAQFLETRRFQNLEIAKLYRVPPHLIDPTVQSSWGKGVEEQNAFFATFTLVPWLTRIEQAINKLLPGGNYVKFNINALLRAKLSERYAAYVTAVNSGILSLDEVRALEDFEPIPGGKGKAHFRPSNLMEVGKPPPMERQPQPPGGPTPEEDPKDPPSEDDEETATDE